MNKITIKPPGINANGAQEDGDADEENDDGNIHGMADILVGTHGDDVVIVVILDTGVG